MQEQAVIPGVQTIMRALLTHHPDLQFRASLDMSRIADFASEMQDGTRFEPVVAFYDGTTTWLSDGYHRDAAAESLDWHTIETDVREGTFLDALAFAYRANAAPGHKQLTARERVAGRQRSIPLFIADGWSNYKIATDLGISDDTVRNDRLHLVSTDPSVDVGPMRTVTRNGTTYQQDVSRIGRRSPLNDDADAPDLFSSVDDESDDDDGLSVDDPIARASKLAREHPSVRWPEAMERLYKFMIGARNAGGFAEMIRGWRPEYRESSKREIDRVIGELTAWRTLLEETR